VKESGGYWWPDYDQSFHLFNPKEAARDIPFFLRMVEGRNMVIQAGGAMGLYPLMLADHFQRVVTFEPDPENWDCLRANLKARDGLKRINAWHAALGATPGECVMDRPNPLNCGANRTVQGEGDIPVLTIDGMRWTGKIDAIWLDVEGSELAALKGAEQTIREHSPVIVTEELGNGERYGVGPTDIEDWLATLGYEREAGVGNDRYYRRKM